MMLESEKKQLEIEIEKLIPYLSQNRIHRIDTVLNNRTDQLVIVLDQLLDIHNISAVLRTCEGFGIYKIFQLQHSNEKNDFKKGISKNAHRWLELSMMPTQENCYHYLKNSGYQIWVASCGPASRDIKECIIPDKLALVMGNEHNGPSDFLTEHSDQIVHIPIKGFIESFNVSVATSLLLFYLTELKKFGTISDDVLLRLKHTYYKNSVRFARHIL